MAKLSAEELIEAFKEMTLIELSEFVKQFEEVFDVPPLLPLLWLLLLLPPLAMLLLRKRSPNSRLSSSPLATRRLLSSRWSRT